MSEYQCYEFLAIDHVLTDQQIGELRSISTRAQITPTSFRNTYNWGDLRGNPLEMVRRYFDVYIYLANWGTRRVVFRLPKRLMDMKAIKRFKNKEAIQLHDWGEMIGIEFGINEVEQELWDDGSDWLRRLVPLRNELLSGDLRSLFIGWGLGEVNERSDPDDELPPPPPGLCDLSPSLNSLVEFLDISPDLMEAINPWSQSRTDREPTREEFKNWIVSLPTDRKDSLLCQWAEGDVAHFRSTLLKQWREEKTDQQRSEKADGNGREPLTFGQLLNEAERVGSERRRREAEAMAREKKKRQQQEKAKRKKYLKALAGNTEETWAEIHRLILTKQPKGYNQATQLLVDLHEISIQEKTEKSFAQKIRAIRDEHKRKLTFIKRLDKAGLPDASCTNDKLF